MKDYFGYKGKICVVTGASSGMGEATTEMLVDLGAKVYAIDLNECKVKGITKYIKCNLSNKEEIDAAFKEIPEEINCFFGIAGLSGKKTDYITTFNCDFTANKYITLVYLANRMKAGSSITYITSTAGKYWEQHRNEQNKVINAKTWEETEKSIEKIAKVAPSTFAYIYAKRCLSQFSAMQSIELGKKGIRVNNVMPGATKTGMKDEFESMAGGEKALISSNGSIGRLATSEEMAYPTVFLGSDMASFINGVDFIIDAGNTPQITLKLKKDPSNVPATNKFILMMAKKMMNKNLLDE